jgi:hypothetical protein
LGEVETRKLDDALAEQCRVLAVRVSRLSGPDVAGLLKVTKHTLGLEYGEVSMLVGMPTAEFVACAEGTRELPERCRDKLAAMLRAANASCTHCGATWWPPQLELCKWCGEPAEEQSRATVNGRQPPLRQKARTW